MRLHPTTRHLLGPALGVLLALVACAPFMPPIGSPFSPQSASATSGSTPESIARGSVPVANAVQGAAQFGEVIPGAAPFAAVIDRYAQGYVAEITRQIAGLDDRQKRWEESHQGRPNTPSDWVWALAFAGAAGASNVFSFKHGQRTGAGGTA